MTPQEIQQYIQAITQGLSPLGDKVATGAKEYYALAYRQSILNGIEDLGMASAFIIGLWILWRWFLRIKDSLCAEKEKYSDFARRGFYRFWCIAATVIGGLVVIICLSLAVDRLANPEYQAIQSMLDSIAGKGK